MVPPRWMRPVASGRAVPVAEGLEPVAGTVRSPDKVVVLTPRSRRRMPVAQASGQRRVSNAGPAVGANGRSFSMITRVLVPVAFVGVLLVLALLPQGRNPGAGHEIQDPETGEYRWVHDWSPIKIVGTSLGIFAGYLLLLSPLLAYRWPLGWVVPARWRRRVHMCVGVLLLLLAVGHGAILPFVGFRQGWLSGLMGLGLLSFHAVTGVWKRPFVASWGATRWRYIHVWTAWAALAISLFHSVLVGLIVHYTHSW